MRAAADYDEAPTGKRRRDWVLAWRIGVGLLALIAAAGGTVLLFAGKAYVKEAAAQQVDAQLAPVVSAVQSLPVQVRILEEARARADTRLNNNTAAINAIQQDLAAIRATQVESAHNNQLNTERILNRLDTLAVRR